MKRSLAILLSILFLHMPCHAQWHDAGFESDHPIIAFGIHDTTLFWCYNSPPDSLIFRYMPPANWARVAYSGIDRSQGFITTFASLGPFFFAGSGPTSTGSGYRSTNNGLNWKEVIGGPIGTNGTYMFAQYATRIARSRDSGLHWEHLAYPAGMCYAAINGLYVFAATPLSGLYRSTDSGGVWSPVTTPISNIRSFAVVDTVIYGSNGTPGQSGGQLVRSNDDGASWSIVTTSFDVSSLVTDSTHLFAGGSNGVYLLNADGSSWTNVNGDSAALQGRGVVALAVFDTFLFADFGPGNQARYYQLFRCSIPEMLDTTEGVVSVPAPRADPLEIYPNPAMDRVTIRFRGETTITSVTVLNVLGSSVLAVANAHKAELTLDLSGLPSGTYFLQVQTQTSNILRTIIIDR